MFAALMLICNTFLLFANCIKNLRFFVFDLVASFSFCISLNHCRDFVTLRWLISTFNFFLFHDILLDVLLSHYLHFLLAALLTCLTLFLIPNPWPSSDSHTAGSTFLSSAINRLNNVSSFWWFLRNIFTLSVKLLVLCYVIFIYLVYASINFIFSLPHCIKDLSIKINL